MRLEHVNLTVSDLDRSIAFYCDLLDLHVRWKGSIGGDLLGAHVGDDHQYLALFQAAADGTWVEDYARTGFNHVGFLVDDLDAARERVEQLGATVHHEADYEPGRRLYLRDPDGHELELVEAPRP
jgi:catechol 2,3-dioxygenase-like lactoylglutathione lyase family enzyme